MTEVAAPPWLAQRVRTSANVPANCTGLSLVGSEIRQHAAGERVTVRAEGKLWWVNHAPLTFSFAPSAAAPDAGVRLDLEPWQPVGLLFATQLANWLNSLAADEVAAPQLEWLLRTTATTLLTLPPCIQPEELDTARNALNGAIQHSVGLQCRNLFRVDLAGISNADEAVAHRAGAEAAVHSEPSSEDYEDEFARNEEYAERRFFIELPELRNAINRYDVADAALGERFREVRYRVQRLSNTRSGRRPQIGGNEPARQASPAVIRIMALASRGATCALDAAWAALATVESTTGHSTIGALTTASVEQLEGALTAMEIQLNRRFTAWWEIEE